MQNYSSDSIVNQEDIKNQTIVLIALYTSKILRTEI